MPTAQHPLAPPTLSGNVVSVDTMLQQPTRITRMIMDITLQRFIADRIFTSGGGVTGGAVIYDQVQANELYATRDVEMVAPAAEFPILISERLAPSVALVEKWGGKTYITDEARQRNAAGLFTNEMRRIGNTLVRKLNQRAIAVLDAAIAAGGGAHTAVGHDWSVVVTGGSSQTNNTGWPAADFAAVQQKADVDELGVTYNLWIVNPQEAMRLGLIYGSQLGNVLQSYGVKIYSSNRVTAGTAYVVAEGEVGEMRVEEPLGTETWRDKDGRQMTWVQTSVRPVMFVTNPYAVVKVTGLAG